MSKAVVIFLIVAGISFFAGCAHAQSTSVATITVHVDKPQGMIDPQIFGHFTEETLTSWEGSASSEILVDRKFSMPEERHPDSPWITGTGGGWEPVRLAGDVTLVQDQQVYYSAPMSQRITNTSGVGAAGVQQSGYMMVFPHITPLQRIPEPLHISSGQKYRVRIAIKNRDLHGTVTVALGKSYEAPDVTHEIPFQGGEEWKVYQFELAVKSDVPDAKFMIYTKSKGTVWVDSASLVRADLDERGFRKDVIEATRTLKVSNVRWPGGWFVSDYHWQDGIGEVDKRPARRNRAWNVYYNNDVGVDEYLAFCRAVGCEPYIVVNVGTGSPDEAAALVEYVNGSPKSHWGSIRAQNGHPEPYNVRLWNIGNEEYLPTLGATSSAGYAQNYLAFAHAMRAADPSIRLVAVGSFELPPNFLPPNHPLAALLRYMANWGTDFFPVAGKETNYYAIHYYEPGDSMNGTYSAEDFQRAATVIAEDLDRKLIPVFQVMKKNGLHIPIALDEWRMSGPKKDGPPGAVVNYNPKGQSPADWAGLGRTGSVVSLLNALSEAPVYNLMQRRPNDFGLSSRTILYAYAMGLFGINRDTVVFTPAAYMVQLYSTRDRCDSLAIDVNSPKFDVPPRAGFEGAMGAATLDVSARKHPDGKVDVFFVNRDLVHPIAVEITVAGGTTPSTVEVDTLSSENVTDWNTFDDPDHVTVHKSPITAKDRTLRIVLPAHSISRMNW
jgi:alpha-L-arabinofuranosidase